MYLYIDFKHLILQIVDRQYNLGFQISNFENKKYMKSHINEFNQ